MNLLFKFMFLIISYLLMWLMKKHYIIMILILLMFHTFRMKKIIGRNKYKVFIYLKYFL
jgi:hypothetical protein